ncbi:hypothetical protein N9Y53_03285 [Candidatus Pelagibacter bacterium]|nr:hypothetical protein [Candidatus Pelagibacter bacterium]
MIRNKKKDIQKFAKFFSPKNLKVSIDMIQSMYTTESSILYKELNVFDDRFSNSEKEYIRFLLKFFSGLDNNTEELADSFCFLVKNKKYKSSMFLLRGLIEAIIFNIYVTHKLFFHFKKKDMNNFLSLFFKANLGHSEYSLKSYELVTSSNLLKKIIKKTIHKKIHINNCKEFYENTNFLTKILDTKKINNFEFFKERENWSFTYKNIEYILNDKTHDLINVYHRLCEIIHPTSIEIHGHKDEISDIEYRSLIYEFANTDALALNLYSTFFKIYIIENIIKNKKDYIESFKSFLR